MDLHHFFKHIYAGAFFVFDDIINRLSNADRKSLRLVLNRSLSGAIFGYMFDRLHFSIHDEDLEVFQVVANHPVASRRVAQIVWNVTVCQTSFAACQYNYSDAYRLDLLARTLIRDRTRFDQNSVSLSQLTDQLRAQEHLAREAYQFQVTKEKRWRSNLSAGTDLQVLSQCLPKLVNLRRINIVSESMGSGIVDQGNFDLWDTPRARAWKSLPFHHFIPRPCPQTRLDISAASDLAARGIEVLCKIKKVGSFIVEPFCSEQLLRTVNEQQEDVDTQTNHTPTYVWRGTGDCIPNITKSSKLTVRLLLESHRSFRDLWLEVWEQGESVYRFRCDLPILHCQQSLEEISYCNFDTMPLLTDYDLLTEAHNSQWSRFSPVRHCPNLRRLRFHEFLCVDIMSCLRVIWRGTSIREVEFHSVSSKKVSWYAIMTKLKEEGQTYDYFSVESCRSPSELWGPEFGAEILAPWNGKSADIVPWLRGDSNVFPLWQGPG